MALLPEFDKTLVKRKRSHTAKSVLQRRAKKKHEKIKKGQEWKLKPRGCESCPLNEVHGINKIKRLDKIKGKKLFVWGMSPFVNENEKCKELVGPSGNLLWEELSLVRIDREDCDIQNVVRCMTASEDEEDGRPIPREPTPQETYCCSKYTDKALEKSRAKVHLVLGAFAAKTLLGKEHKKNANIFWSERLQAHVACVYHPSFFLRRGFQRAKLLAFRSALKAVKELISGKSGQFSFIKKQNFIGVTDHHQAKDLVDELIEKSKHKNERVAIDLENNSEYIIQSGFCINPKEAFTIYTGHPELKASSREKEKLQYQVSRVVEDPLVKKVLHNGISDAKTYKRFWGIDLLGYDYDSMYAEYLRWSNRHSYALAEIAQVRFPEYAGYKEILHPYLKNQEKVDYAAAPMKVLTPYNCTDAQLCKKIEKSTRDGISLSLLKVYVYASYIINEMMDRGPILDRKQLKLCRQVIPQQVKKLERKLQHMADDDTFNPGSHPQVKYIIYDKLKLKPVVFDRKTEKPIYKTDKEVISIMTQQGHEFPTLMGLWRPLSKMETYFDNYERSADKFEETLRTVWWLCGTETGRLRSSGGDDSAKINMQNLHGDPLLQNLLVSDSRWRDVL